MTSTKLIMTENKLMIYISGLFSRVILMSGSALSPWAIARDTDIYSKNLAKALNCPILVCSLHLKLYSVLNFIIIF
jgi:hypothetical protein